MNCQIEIKMWFKGNITNCVKYLVDAFILTLKDRNNKFLQMKYPFKCIHVDGAITGGSDHEITELKITFPNYKS